MLSEHREGGFKNPSTLESHTHKVKPCESNRIAIANMKHHHRHIGNENEEFYARIEQYTTIPNKDRKYSAMTTGKLGVRKEERESRQDMKYR